MRSGVSMCSVITVGARAVRRICSVVYQAGLFDAPAYKNGTGGLHSRGAMGTDAATIFGGCRADKLTQWRSIMKRATKIAIGVAAALSLGLAAAVVSAHPHGYGPGWGMGQGYGPGAGMGPGMGPGGGPGSMGYG